MYQRFLWWFLLLTSFLITIQLRFYPHERYSTMNRYLSTGRTVTRENFWTALGAPKFISAPMVGQSNMAWRVLVRKHGVDMTFTEMVHSRNFVKSKTYRQQVIDWLDYTASNGSREAEENARLLDRPLVVQLAGDNPEFLVETARTIEKHGVTAIDLNLGCPQKIAKRGHYGAYLLQEKDLIVRLLSSMVAGTSCPITAKIRRLPSEQDTLTLAKAIENTGVSMLTVHGRLITQNKQFTGPVDWDIIRKIKQSLSIPVVANGGVESRADAIRCLQETGVDAVMSSEGLLQNPKLFSPEGDVAYRESFVASQLQTAKEYLALTMLYPLPYAPETVVRGHLFKLLHRFFCVEMNFDLREIMTRGSIEQMIQVVNELDNRMKKLELSDQLENNFVSDFHWYRRHWEKGSKAVGQSGINEQ